MIRRPYLIIQHQQFQYIVTNLRPIYGPRGLCLITQQHSWRLSTGWQCGYPNLCPDFDPCLGNVQHFTNVWLLFVLVLYFSYFCLINPTFVLSRSNICPRSPTFVLYLSSDLAEIHPKIRGLKLVIVGNFPCFYDSSAESRSGFRV